MFKLLFSVLACIVIVGDVVAQNSSVPAIIYISPNQAKVNQGPTDFICKVENIAGYDVLWKRSNGNFNSEAELISTNTSVNISDGRFSVSFDPSTSSFNLHLNDVWPTDEGTYICEIPFNSTHNISKKTLLELNVVPHFLLNYTASEITVNVSADVKIECYAEGSPMPVVYIMRDNGAPLRNNQAFLQGNVLEIKNITKSEGGRYRCLANNTASSVPRYIQVNVQAPPIISACSLSLNYYPVANVALECKIESHVTPDIIWFENDRNYSSDATESNFESMVTSTGTSFTASLKINSTSKTETMYYTIRTSNSLGESKAIVGQFSSIPSCPRFDCPSSSCFVSNLFMVIFLIIIVVIIGIGFVNRELIRKFKIERERPFKITYLVPTNDF